jgi:CheY-like chemotaxis protein
MPTPQKLLLLDDDQEIVEVYRDLLARLPSQPEVFIATSGARALSFLESENFTVLLSDLKMPKMDGLQVLTIVRRKFPHLRTAIMTAVTDEQFRARAYAIGVDLFLEKPSTSKETAFFLDCIESLLGREETGGFRGIQSKSLVDLLQLECLSQSSSTLKITNHLLEGKIWIQKGEITDAATSSLSGETAFRQILSWKTGNFEILPPDKARPRTIFASYQGLLLETAQAFDEAKADEQPSLDDGNASSPSAGLAQFKGVEFVVITSSKEKEKYKVWGVENPERMAEWVRQSMDQFRSLGENLEAGQLNQIQALGPQRQLALVSQGEKEICLSSLRSSSPELVLHNLKTILSTWAC